MHKGFWPPSPLMTCIISLHEYMPMSESLGVGVWKHNTPPPLSAYFLPMSDNITISLIKKTHHKLGWWISLQRIENGRIANNTAIYRPNFVKIERKKKRHLKTLLIRQLEVLWYLWWDKCFREYLINTFHVKHFSIIVPFS